MYVIAISKADRRYRKQFQTTFTKPTNFNYVCKVLALINYLFLNPAGPAGAVAIFRTKKLQDFF